MGCKAISISALDYYVWLENLSLILFSWMVTGYAYWFLTMLNWFGKHIGSKYASPHTAVCVCLWVLEQLLWGLWDVNFLGEKRKGWLCYCYTPVL